MIDVALVEIAEEGRIAARGLLDAARGLFDPTLRLGVTGLSRAGKTVFISALIEALRAGRRLPVLSGSAQGRIVGAKLAPQPDDAVPRFEIEDHLAALTVERRWPESTRHISELRLVITYQSAGWLGRRFGPGTLTLDIVDYPGEWLLDLALLPKSYADWSAETLALSRQGTRLALAAEWHAHLKTLRPNAPADEGAAREAAALFTAYLRACRDDRLALSTLPPGRFLMPGDLDGSPALTFAPLDIDGEAQAGSLRAMMERRFEAYKTHVARPFFREHFARLDRQIVLVDVLAALNAGPAALADLERALGDILSAFRVGARDFWSSLLRPRADRILFAATKADHLHHRDHDRLEAILARLTERARRRADVAGAAVDVIALAAIRATREAVIHSDGAALDAIAGTPMKGERVGDEVFDGETDVALFPGDLPDDPERALREGRDLPDPREAAIRFVRFRPPRPEPGGERGFPHIRLDRALEFLIGDRLA